MSRVGDLVQAPHVESALAGSPRVARFLGLPGWDGEGRAD